MSKQSGQSLIEVLVGLSIAAVVLGGLLISIMVSLKNAQFAQNQARATKYAQEAIDQIRAIKERNSTVTFAAVVVGSSCQGATACNGNTSCKFKHLWFCSLPLTEGASSFKSPCTVKPLGGVSGCYFNLSADGLNLNEPNSPDLVNQSLSGGFSRQILLSDPGFPLYGTEKNVNVKVKWSDSSGEHESNLETVLTNR
ncbi:type II secretion system protein [Candidatus Daviesbacteria bacterium]|nr:type II secretion system protein [Candidatus Daviesbacteria bacterium]